MLKFFSKISSAADLLLTEARISDSYRKKLSKSKPSLYLLMDSSKLFKDVASLDLMRHKEVDDKDLLHIVKRSQKYRQGAGERLVESNKRYCSLSNKDLQLLIDKNVQIEWATKHLNS